MRANSLVTSPPSAKVVIPALKRKRPAAARVRRYDCAQRTKPFVDGKPLQHAIPQKRSDGSTCPCKIVETSRRPQFPRAAPVPSGGMVTILFALVSLEAEPHWSSNLSRCD